MKLGCSALCHPPPSPSLASGLLPLRATRSVPSLPAGPVPHRHHHPPLPSSLQGLSPTAITNLAWAFAVVGHRDNKLFAALAKAAVPQKV